MDFGATQIFDDRDTNDDDNDEKEKKLIGILRVESKEYEILEGLNRIGRSPLCKIVLKDPTVSNVHAEIQAGPEATFITDLRSSNGTKLKNLSLKHFFFYPINDGDIVVFGRVRATYTIIKNDSKRNIDVTPKTIRKHDVSFDDLDVSVIPGSQKNVDKHRLFRQPSKPVDVQKSRVRISDIGEKSENNDDSMDIYEMETQDIIGHQKNILKKTPNVKVTTKSKNRSDIHEMETQDMTANSKSHVDKVTSKEMKKTKELKESSKNARESMDLHNMETQKILDDDSFRTRSSRRSKSQRSPDVFTDRANDDIYEAETQLLMTNEELPPKTKSANRRNSETARDSLIENKSRPKECRVIAETDDESKTTDDEIANFSRSREINDFSDESVTDNENEFANLSKFKSAARKEKRSTTLKRKMNEVETDIDLLPTQVLDVATSTPVLIPETRSVDFDESLPVIDDEPDIHNAPTQIISEENEKIAKSSSVIASQKEKSTRKSGTNRMNLNDTLDRNLDNIFGNEATSEVEMDEPTQLMTQNLVDILKPTQNFADETRNPIHGIEDDIENNESKSPEKKRSKTIETLGFVNGQAIPNRDEFSPTSTKNDQAVPNKKKKSDTETTDFYRACHQDSYDRYRSFSSSFLSSSR